MTITWNATSLAISEEGVEIPLCRDCQSSLNVHQPDEERPEHLLGTCAECGSWYLIEVDKDGTEAFLFDLPNVIVIRKAMVPVRSVSGRKRAPKNPAREGKRKNPDGQVA